MPYLSTQMTIAATGSIISSAWISGGITTLSLNTIPAILQIPNPETLIRAWHTQFTRALYIPTTAVIAALNYWYLAYRHRNAGLEWRGYAGAGMANLLLPPFTLYFIMGINRSLIASVSGVQGKTLSLNVARQLITRWGDLNFYRIFMPLAGAGLGLWNLLC